MLVSGHRNGNLQGDSATSAGAPSPEKIAELKKRSQNMRMKIKYSWTQWLLLCARAYAAMFCSCRHNPSLGHAWIDD